MGINVQVSPQFQGMVESAGQPQNPSNNNHGIVKYDSLSYFPKAKHFGEGAAQFGKYQYASNGISWTPLNGGPIPFNTVVALGSSFVVRTTPSATGFNAYGILTQLNALIGQRMDIVNYDGVNGSGAIAVSPYIDRLNSSVFSYNPAYCYVDCSVNDFVTTYTFDEIIYAYSSLFSAINNAGIKVLGNTVNPDDRIDTATKQTIWNQFNHWILNEAPKLFDITVSDQSYATRASGASVLSDADATLTDGTHPKYNGVIAIAKAISPAYLAEFTNQSPIDKVGYYSGGANAMELNPFNEGTSGIMFNGSNTGVASDNMVCGALSGTGVWSKVARDDHPSFWQKVVWTPAVINQYCQYANVIGTRSRPLSADFQVGDIVQYVWEIKIGTDIAASDVGAPGFKLTFDGTAISFDAAFLNSQDPAAGFNDYIAIYATPKIAIPAGTTGISALARILCKTLNAQTYYFGRHGLINYSR